MVSSNLCILGLFCNTFVIWGLLNVSVRLSFILSGVHVSMNYYLLIFFVILVLRHTTVN